MAPPPVVTGLSPNEGPPGTRIKIRGEHFGTKPTDLIGLTICGVDCLLSAEWKSENKIIAISGPIKGKGDVIVTTRNGGVGTCNVTFRGYQQTAIGPLKESAVWIEEAPLTYGWGRHSLSPSIYQQKDPLDLNIEEDDNRISEDDLLAYFPNKSGDIGSNNFSAGWFLLENHLTTSFNDLQAGLKHLEWKVKSQKEGQLSFLKANIGSVMDQVDTLVHLKEKYEQDIKLYGSEPTLKLKQAIKESEREARKLFDDVLSRRDRAEKTRNALNVLGRFKFLFCLPCIIDRNIKKGEYDIVINDYIRVKNLFRKTDVPIFKSALNEIDKRMDDLQKKLHTDLQTMPITVQQQKRLIRYLINLDAPYDPAWDAIKARSDYISKKLKSVYSYYKQIDKGEKSSKSTPVSQSVSKIKHHLNQNNDINNTTTNVPVCVCYIDELCTTISETFPDLWKIGQAYFSEELQIKIEPGRQVQFKHMVMDLIETFTKSIRAVLIPNTLDKLDRSNYGTLSMVDRDEIARYLPELLRSIRFTYSTLIKLDLPSEALDIVSQVLLDLRIHCMIILFKQTKEHIMELTENWKINFNSKYSGITQLPVKFLQLIEDVIQIVKESVLATQQRESSLMDEETAQKELHKQLDGIFNAFVNVLNNLSSTDDTFDNDDNSTPIVSQLIGTPVIHNNKLQKHNNIPSWEQRLLITLSNCLFTKDVILDDIEKKFRESEFRNIDSAISSAKIKLQDLEKVILDKYFEQKSDPIVGTIEPSMYLGHFDWDTNITPTDIRPYAKECINNVIHVHSEVNSISALLLNKILPKIVETIAEELYRLMSCIKTFTKCGAQQARADIATLEKFFHSYTNENAANYFHAALQLVPPLEPMESTVVEDIVKNCSVQMKIQMICLNGNQVK